MANYIRTSVDTRLEKRIEQGLCRRVIAEGGEPYKFISPGRNGVPDRLLAFGIGKLAQRLSELGVENAEDEARALLATCVRFVECKSPYGRISIPQQREIERLRRRGFTVEIVDD